MQVTHLKLCACRAFWLVVYPSQGHEMLFGADTCSISALGGVPRGGIYDNMKIAVDKVNKGKGRTVKARFAVMCAHYLFGRDFSNVAAGWEKGIVGKIMQDSRRRIWLGADYNFTSSKRSIPGWLNAVARSGTSWRTRNANAAGQCGLGSCHAGALRRLRRACGAGGQHLSGQRGAQPLFGVL